jgi:type III secretion protein U
MSDEKTEEPTQKKLDEARDKGQNPKSQDVNAAAQLMLSTVMLVLSSLIAGPHLQKLFDIVNRRAWTATTDDEVLALMFSMLVECVFMSAPYLLAAALVGAIAGVAQTGIIISFEPLMPNFDKLNPAEGIKKLFSMRSIIDFIKMLIKAVLFGAVLYLTITSLLPMLIGTSLQDPMLVAAVAWHSIIKLMGAATIIFIVIGPVDFGIQKWMFIRDQRMTKDEIKREHKESEGDPELKGKRKQLAKEMVMGPPPQKTVPGASVVVTNPTHYAVALRYDAEMPLPVVVAKGVDETAATIRALAEMHKVPMVSNPPLARALFKVDLEAPVPEALFEAVAAVLRWVGMIGVLSEGLGALPAAAGAAAPRSE